MENRLTKTISVQNLYDVNLHTNTSYPTYIISVGNISNSPYQNATFGTYLECLRDKSNVVEKVSALGYKNTGLAYSDQSSYKPMGYALEVNDICKSNVAIWKSFWNEIGDDVDSVSGTFPIICSGVTKCQTSINSFDSKTNSYNFEHNFSNSASGSTTSFPNQNIVLSTALSNVIKIDPNESITIDIDGTYSYSVSYGKPQSLLDWEDEGINGFGGTITNFTYKGTWLDAYSTSGSLIYFRLLDDSHNLLQSYTLGSMSSTSLTFNKKFAYTNTTSTTKYAKYFEIVLSNIILKNGTDFVYDWYDNYSDEVGTSSTYEAKITFYLTAVNFKLKCLRSSSVTEIPQSQYSYYIIPHCCYEIDLNNEWCGKMAATGISDNSAYDGPYQSWYNYGNYEPCAKMYIDIHGYDTFKLYIRSDGATNFDYVMVSQLDKDIDGDTLYTNTSLVKAHTRGTPNSGATIDDYTPVIFSNIGGGDHRITIIYRKDNNDNEGTDRGYVVIPTGQEKYSSVDIKGSRFMTLWGENNPRFWPRYDIMTIENEYDNIICNNNSLGTSYIYMFNKDTGKYDSYRYSSGTPTSRFMSNFHNIKNKLIQEGFSNPSATWLYSVNPNDTSNNIAHITMKSSCRKNTPTHNISASVTVPELPTSFIQTGDNWIFYPALTDISNGSQLPAGISTYLTPFRDIDGVAVYIVPAYSYAASSTGYIINAYVGFWDTSQSIWVPNTTASGTNINIATNLTPCSLNLYYNNIVVVYKSESYNAIDVYRYERVNGELINYIRKLSFN